MDQVKEKSCEARIDEQLENLEESVIHPLEHYYDGDQEGEWNNYPLAVSTYQLTKIELSWGGPSDFLEVKHEGADIRSITYHFQDWFDGAKRDVEEGSKVWEYCATVIQSRDDCGY
jgi:hypothetical protein